jgi:hypothetical protein
MASAGVLPCRSDKFPQASTPVRTILLLATVAALSGCTISTELGPGGFQGGRHVERNVTGSNLAPRDETDRGGAKRLAPEDVGRLQQNTGSKDTK